jgi:hypothetical protein
MLTVETLRFIEKVINGIQCCFYRAFVLPPTERDLLREEGSGSN